MARTILRGRSGDIVTTLRVADRTGILAASAPPRAGEPDADPEPPSALPAANQGKERPAARHVGRTLLLACAAALFLIVGWIGGGVFAQRGGGDTPVAAVGAALDQEQGGTSRDVPPPAPPVPAQALPAALPPAPPITGPSTAKAVSSASSKSSGSSASQTRKSKPTTEAAASDASTAPVATERVNIPLPAEPASVAVAEQLRQLTDAWSWAGPRPFGGR